MPRLAAADQEDLVLSLPPHLSAYSIAWVSVWCRKFSVDFGHVIVSDTDNGEWSTDWSMRSCLDT